MIANGRTPGEQEEAKSTHLLQLWINIYIQNVTQFRMMMAQPGLGIGEVPELVAQICAEDDSAVKTATRLGGTSGELPMFSADEAKAVFLSALGAALLTVARPGFDVAKSLANDCNALVAKIAESGKSPLEFVYFLLREADGRTHIKPVSVYDLIKLKKNDDTEATNP